MNQGNQSDYYDLQSEDFALAAAIASAEWARSPDFSHGLFSDERLELAMLIHRLAVENQQICEANLKAKTDDEMILSAFRQADAIPNPPSGKAIVPVIEKLRTLKMRRAMAGKIQSLHGEIPALNGSEILEKVNTVAIAAQEVMDSASAEDLKDGTDLAELVDMLQRKVERPDELLGLEFGFHCLEKILDGLQGGRLITIAGRPHTGKTTVAMAMLLGLVKNQKKVAFFSGEMTYSQIQQVMLDMLSGVTLIPGKPPTKGELTEIQAAFKEMTGFQWWIDDSDRLPIDRICAKARAAHHRRGLDCIFIDYIQIVSGSQHTDDMRMQVSEVTGKLKALSKELKVPVVAMCQINRGTVRTDPETGKPVYGRPSITQLKESSSIESDSDVVILIHRELENEEDGAEEVDMDLIIGKNRCTGIMVDVPCKFNLKTRAIREQSHLVRGIN